MDLGKIAMEAGSKEGATPSRSVNIIEFVEASWGLGKTVQLYPAQKVILKAYYGIPLDTVNKVVPVTDFRRENLRMMTEAEYLEHLHREGRCNISKVEPGKERTEMVLCIGRRSGKCIDKDTLVLTENGFQRIGEMGYIPIESHIPYITTVAQEGKSKRSKSAYFYNGGVKPTLTVTTKSGFQIKGTLNHQVRVFDPASLEMTWKYMVDIKAGDLLGIHCGTEMWPDKDPDISSLADSYPLDLTCPREWTPDWARLMGYLLVRGKIHKGRIECFAIRSTVDYVRDLFSLTIQDHHSWKEGNTYKVVASCASAVALYRVMGAPKGQPKQIPAGFLRFSEHTQAAFLAGALEASYFHSLSSMMEFRFKNLQIAREIQILLANFGVFSSLVKKIDKNSFYCISIQGFDLDTAAGRIFKFSPILASACTKIEKNESLSNEPLPGIRQHLPAILEEASHSFRAQNLITGLLSSPKSPVLQESIDHLCKILRTMDNQGPVSRKLLNIIETGYRFDPVASIKQTKSDVYDLNVPEGESFVANAITNHNTFISSCIAAYEVYKLVTKGCPQKYYGMPAGKVIQLIAVATDKNQASNLYGDVSAHFRESLFFAPYMANNTMSYARVQTPYDIEKYGPYADNKAAQASIKITFSPCKAKAVRGFANIVAIFDEMAHFGEAGQSSAEEIYTAAEPSLATFTPKRDNVSIGPLESKIISISSPLGRTGKFYDLFQSGFKGGQLGEKMLCVQAPTWEINPTVSREVFETAYERDPIAFFTEYGAEFTDRARGWITDKVDLLDCVVPSLKKQTRGKPGIVYYAGFDLGLAGDSSAIAIGHIEFANRSPKIIVDVVDFIQAGVGQYEKQERLEFDDVANWVLDYTRRFRIVEGVFDQHTGIPFEQALTNRGISNFKKEFFKPQLTSDIFKNFKDLLWDQSIQFYNSPLEEGQELCDYLAELMTLQANVRSKFITTVEAPKAAGYHDDMSDALVRMVWLASKHMQNPRIITGHNPMANPNFAPLTAGRALRKYGGGSNPSRRVLPKRRR